LHKLPDPTIPRCPECRRAYNKRYNEKRAKGLTPKQLGLSKPQPPKKLDSVFVAEIRAGRCDAKGHDLTLPGAVKASVGRSRICTECRKERGWVRPYTRVNGMCGSGKHKLPSPPPRVCTECRKENARKHGRLYRERQAAKSNRALLQKDDDLITMLKEHPNPPSVVLAEAACSPADAELFDPITREEQQRYGTRSILDRLTSARTICARCPALTECLSDGLQNKRSGIYGGRYLRDGVATDKLFPGRPAHPETRTSPIRADEYQFRLPA